MPVAYRNTRTGRVVHMAEHLVSMDRSKRWERVDPEPIDVTPLDRDPDRDPEHVEGLLPTAGGPFDPSEHTVQQVNDYLAGAEQAERERVLQAEAAGRARRGITSGPHADQSGA
jgi:hypothetical protein